MYIVSNYRLINQQVFLSDDEKILCPECMNGHLHYYDHCKRIIRYHDSADQWLSIPRYQCDNEGCSRIHRMIPDILTPFKHYAEETISDVISEVITVEDGLDTPSDQTIVRWNHWIIANELNINGIMRSVAYRELGYSDELLHSRISILKHIQSSFDNWLRFVIRFVYNSGNKLDAVY